VATSISGTNLTTDDELEDEEEGVPTTHSGADNQDRRNSTSSSITNFTINKTTSDFQLSSKASSRASGINLPPLISTATGPNSKRLPGSPPPIPRNIVGTKEKHGVRKFIQKIFKSSSSSNTPKSQGSIQSSSTDSPKSPGLNIDLVRGTAYPPQSPLPITQGPIRLLVLRHGERLDRYYSSQWLRQAFDKDGNFCRFSPILP
jgi:hypothetical protein